MALDKQIRLRASDEEKSHLETAAKDGGYSNLSDYLRPILLEQNVIIVKPAGEFIVIPAFTADEEEREAAVLTVKALIALAAQHQEPSPGPDGGSLLPEDQTATPGEEEDPATPSAPDGAASIAAAGAVPDPSPQIALAEEPPPAVVAPTILGPVPLPTENYENFLQRRVPELQVEGRTPLIAAFEAESEWRAAMSPPAAPATQPEAPESPAATPAAQANFCGNCGGPLEGKPFCGNCGAPAA